VTRTGPSAADKELLELLAARGVKVSGSGLERWRHVGLVPRPRHVHLGRRGSRAEYERPLEEVADHVAAVAARSRRGRSAALTAVAVTADGYVVDGELLREGHREAAGQAETAFARWSSQAGEFAPGWVPVDELDWAEQLAAVMLTARTSTRAFWRRNVAADKELLVGSTVDAVLGSAVTAMLQLIVGGDPSPGGVYEAAVALGVRDFALALANGGEPTELNLEDREVAVANVLREQFDGVPIPDRLAAVVDAPAEALRAASAVAVTVWLLLDRAGALGLVAGVIPAPTGDNPAMHTVAVAIVLHMAATVGLDVEPLCQLAVEASLLNPDEAGRCVAAAAVLSDPPARATRC
jgi:hypothetical protein